MNSQMIIQYLFQLHGILNQKGLMATTDKDCFDSFCRNLYLNIKFIK